MTCTSYLTSATGLNDVAAAAGACASAWANWLHRDYGPYLPSVERNPRTANIIPLVVEDAAGFLNAAMYVLYMTVKKMPDAALDKFARYLSVFARVTLSDLVAFDVGPENVQLADVVKINGKKYQIFCQSPESVRLVINQNLCFPVTRHNVSFDEFPVTRIYEMLSFASYCVPICIPSSHPLFRQLHDCYLSTHTNISFLVPSNQRRGFKCHHGCSYLDRPAADTKIFGYDIFVANKNGEAVVIYCPVNSDLGDNYVCLTERGRLNSEVIGDSVPMPPRVQLPSSAVPANPQPRPPTSNEGGSRDPLPREENEPPANDGDGVPDPDGDDGGNGGGQPARGADGNRRVGARLKPSSRQVYGMNMAALTLDEQLAFRRAMFLVVGSSIGRSCLNGRLVPHLRAHCVPGPQLDSLCRDVDTGPSRAPEAFFTNDFMPRMHPSDGFDQTNFNPGTEIYVSLVLLMSLDLQFIKLVCKAAPSTGDEVLRLFQTRLDLYITSIEVPSDMQQVMSHLLPRLGVHVPVHGTPNGNPHALSAIMRKMSRRSLVAKCKQLQAMDPNVHFVGFHLSSDLCNMLTSAGLEGHFWNRSPVITSRDTLRSDHPRSCDCQNPLVPCQHVESLTAPVLLWENSLTAASPDDNGTYVSPSCAAHNISTSWDPLCGVPLESVFNAYGADSAFAIHPTINCVSGTASLFLGEGVVVSGEDGRIATTVNAGDDPSRRDASTNVTYHDVRFAPLAFGSARGVVCGETAFNFERVQAAAIGGAYLAGHGSYANESVICSITRSCQNTPTLCSRPCVEIGFGQRQNLSNLSAKLATLMSVSINFVDRRPVLVADGVLRTANSVASAQNQYTSWVNTILDHPCYSALAAPTRHFLENSAAAPGLVNDSIARYRSPFARVFASVGYNLSNREEIVYKFVAAAAVVVASFFVASSVLSNLGRLERNPLSIVALFLVQGVIMIQALDARALVSGIYMAATGDVFGCGFGYVLSRQTRGWYSGLLFSAGCCCSLAYNLHSLPLGLSLACLTTASYVYTRCVVTCLVTCGERVCVATVVAGDMPNDARTAYVAACAERYLDPLNVTLDIPFVGTSATAAFVAYTQGLSGCFVGGWLKGANHVVHPDKLRFASQVGLKLRTWRDIPMYRAEEPTYVPGDVCEVDLNLDFDQIDFSDPAKAKKMKSDELYVADSPTDRCDYTGMFRERMCALNNFCCVKQFVDADIDLSLIPPEHRERAEIALEQCRVQCPDCKPQTVVGGPLLSVGGDYLDCRSYSNCPASYIAAYLLRVKAPVPPSREHELLGSLHHLIGEHVDFVHAPSRTLPYPENTTAYMRRKLKRAFGDHNVDGGEQLFDWHSGHHGRMNCDATFGAFVKKEVNIRCVNSNGMRPTSELAAVNKVRNGVDIVKPRIVSAPVSVIAQLLGFLSTLPIIAYLSKRFSGYPSDPGKAQSDPDAEIIFEEDFCFLPSTCRRAAGAFHAKYMGCRSGCLDVSAMDASQRPRNYHRIYEWMFHATTGVFMSDWAPFLSRWFSHVENNMVLTMNIGGKARFRVPPFLPSGVFLTTLANTLKMFMVYLLIKYADLNKLSHRFGALAHSLSVLRKMFRGMAAGGDDALFYYDGDDGVFRNAIEVVYQFLGHNITLSTGSWEQASVYSSFFCRAMVFGKEEYVLTPFIGRQLVKSSYIVNDTGVWNSAEAAAIFAQKRYALYLQLAHVPGVSRYFEKQQHNWGLILKRGKPFPMPDAPYLPSTSTLCDIAAFYSMTFDEVNDALSSVAATSVTDEFFPESVAKFFLREIAV